MDERQTVLVVDDEPEVGAVLWDILSRHGYAPHVCASPEAALRFARQEDPPLAIVDIRLAETSGIDLLQRLRRDSPRIRVIMITGATDKDLPAMALRAGAIACLRKPIRPQSLLEMLEFAASQPS
jgi:DNA-binding response OmpR family regulator